MTSTSPFARIICFAVGLFALRLAASSAMAQAAKAGVLRIGSTASLTGKSDSAQEQAGAETLKKFIKEQTGLDNEISGQEPWRDLADKLAKGKLDLGVFQGYEFAWAQKNDPALKPLAVGVNVHRYPVAIVMVRRDNPAKDFAGLKGQTLVIPVGGQTCLRLFVDRTCAADGQKTEAWFSKIAAPENVEDALDDVVDNKGQAIVVDQAGLDAYKRRKPGRFNQLRELLRSEAFPPVVVACHRAALDDKTREKFKEALLGAGRKEKGEMLLTLSRLSAFQPVPDDFERILEATRKKYPEEK